MPDRDQLSHGIKIPFLISFLNKFRNKIHKVQGASNNSNLVYQINSQELEDTINSLGKDLMLFCEKELKTRLDTASNIFENQQRRVLELATQNKMLLQQIHDLERDMELQIQSKVLLKCNALLFEMEKNNRIFSDFKKYTQGLEELIRARVEKQYKAEMDQMKT